MEILNATNIYWFTSAGLLIGFIMGLIIGNEGMSVGANIIWGVVGANVMGMIGIWMGFGDGLWFMFIALWPFLFLFNVFHQHHIEDLTGEMEHPVKVMRK
ncbi:MAG: hypothetical protein JJU13_17550 [Balneolaceae bacterium]|nr:hypothetical protein [Balneolaceae bacterium]